VRHVDVLDRIFDGDDVVAPRLEQLGEVTIELGAGEDVISHLGELTVTA